MNKLKLNKPFVGFFLMALTLILTFVAFIMSFRVYNIFGYAINRWAVFLTFAALWFTAFLIVNALFVGERPFWVSLLYVAVCVALTFAAILFVQPCLAPMGIYFTVGNMGDVEANAAGVPRTIVTVVLYVVALLLMVVSAFCPSVVVERSSEVTQ